MNMEISKRLLVIICGSCILLAYLTIFLHNPRSPTNADASPSMHMDGSIKILGLESETNPDPLQPVLVLVLAYMRSGSSLTGDILQHSPGAFYLYEPFRSMDNKNTSNYTLIYANGSKRKPPFTFQEETYDALYNWFTCNISKIPVIGLMDPFMNRGIKSKMFPLCYHKENEKVKNETPAIRICARQFQGICLDSPFRIIKTIRLQLHDIKHLLEDLPNLKIIHLVRDPRGILSSQEQIGWCAASNVKVSCANVLCRRLEDNTLEEERLLKMYPDRIKTIFYEDIARHPLRTSKQMYDFIGANFTLEAQKYIYNITMAGKKDDCEICSTRSNASEHVDAWKKTLKIEFLKVINERCNYILKRYEFDTFPKLQKKQYMPII